MATPAPHRRDPKEWAWRAALIAALVLTLLPASARAQPSGRDRFFAEKRLQEGRRLVGQRRFAEACRKLEESEGLWPRNSTLLELSYCHEQEGKTATAYAELGQVKQNGDAVQRQNARRRMAALEPRLSRLTVELAADADATGLEVAVDEASLAKDAIGKPSPIDPGEHLISAKAPDRNPWSTRVTVGPRGDKKTVTVPVLEKAAAGTGAVPEKPQPPAPRAPVAPPPEPKPAAPGAPGALQAPGALRVYTRVGAALYTSEARTAGGLGGGLGVRYPLGGWFLVQGDLDYLFSLGNAFEVRVGFGAQRPGVYTPAIALLAIAMMGDQLSFFTEAHPAAVKGPVIAGGLALAPLRFSGESTHVSLLEVELEVGTDLPGLGLCFGVTAVEVGASF